MAQLDLAQQQAGEGLPQASEEQLVEALLVLAAIKILALAALAA